MKLQDVLTEPLQAGQLYERVKSRIAAGRSEKDWTVGERVEYFRKRFPAMVADVCETAEKASRGELILPGTMGAYYYVGEPPLWYANPVNDVEFVVALNRMFHWKTLTYGYLLSGDARYRDKVLGELRHWIETCPRPGLPVHDPEETRRIYFSIIPWNLLCAGIRMFDAWPMALEFLIDDMTPELLEKFAVSVHEHGVALAEASPVLWPNAQSNHYLMEQLGLLSAACMLPELKKAEEWKRSAVREIERCAELHLTEDGGQMEGSPHYHNGTIGWFIRALDLARRNGLAFSAECARRIEAAVGYSAHAFRPSGTTVPWGDSDADHSAVYAALSAYVSLGRTEELRCLVRLVGAEAAIQSALHYSNASAYEQIMWRADDPEEVVAAIREMEREPAPSEETGLALISWQRELSQVMLRTSWSREALSLFFACRSPVVHMHQHIDLMGFDFTAYGRPLIVDPGRFTYREDENRRLFKSSAWHNTLTINYREPFDFISSMRYGPSKLGKVEKVYELEQVAAVQAMHVNYEPATHRRLAALVERKFLLILDQMTSTEPIFSAQLYYHFDSERVALSADRRTAFSRDEGQANVAVHGSANLFGELLPGKISDKLDEARDSVRLCFREHVRGVELKPLRAYATVIYPVRSGETAPAIADLTVLSEEPDRKVDCSFQIEDRSYRVVWDPAAAEFIFE